jgi:hypothetical protein
MIKQILATVVFGFWVGGCSGMGTAKVDPGVGGGGEDPMNGSNPPDGSAPAADGGMTPPAGMMPPPTMSAVDTLAAAGLDVNALPALDTLTSKQLQAVMTSFTVSLGVDCTGCHVKNDFQAATRNKNIARNMWVHLAQGLEHTDGSAVYCDSCHKGQAVFLDRSDAKKLMGYMKANFVTPLKRRDGKTHDCTTCHGSPFVGSFLDSWAM